ncbi:hypothetical protein RND81_13G078100 [Saponaria officinalis]|uniref:Uncharacterized protein n=1 Tax=Saponaria officinalis TaxID=3572 RepID=A0AAW1H1I0_SAPOF
MCHSNVSQLLGPQMSQPTSIKVLVKCTVSNPLVGEFRRNGPEGKYDAIINDSSRQCKDVFPFSTLSLRPCCSVDDPRRYICKDTLLRFINLDVDAPLLAVIVVVLLSDACCCMLLAVDCNYNY